VCSLSSRLSADLSFHSRSSRKSNFCQPSTHNRHSQVVYFGRCIPWLIIDAIPYFRKWKIQQDKQVSNEQIWACTKDVLLTHFTCEFPLIYLFHPICCYFGMSTFEVPFTPIPIMLAQIAFFFVFEDTFHYWAHRALHWGPLYKHIHKKHHSE
jgi:methylsterol monooxygenase